MDFLNNTDPSKVVNPNISEIGNCKFRSYISISKAETKAVCLAPYLDNDGDIERRTELLCYDTHIMLIHLDICTEDAYDVDIILTSSGKFLTKLHVAAAFYGSIIGTRGSRKREIELCTDTQIKIPRHDESGDIIVTGTTERSVAAARLRILMIVLRNRDHKPVTHFVSVRMSSVEIMENFAKFKESILHGTPLRGVDESLFQTAEKLHLTITPLVLLDEVETNVAVQALHDYKSTIKDSFKNARPIKIILKGLEIMNDDPTEVDVLYGKVAINIPEYNQRFQELADGIQSLLSSKGLVKKLTDGVKLHVTLMNSLFRKRAENIFQRETFDATDILDKFKEFYFGEVELKEISLVIRFTVADDKFYQTLAVIEI